MDLPFWESFASTLRRWAILTAVEDDAKATSEEDRSKAEWFALAPEPSAAVSVMMLSRGHRKRASHRGLAVKRGQVVERTLPRWLISAVFRLLGR
jgi:hypothetical protein